MEDKPGPFGTRLKELRIARKLTQRGLGKLIGVSHTRIGEWERGDDRYWRRPTVPPYRTVVSMARILGVPPRELLLVAGYNESFDEEERLLIETYRTLDPHQRELFRRFGTNLAREGGSEPGRGYGIENPQEDGPKPQSD